MQGKWEILNIMLYSFPNELLKRVIWLYKVTCKYFKPPNLENRRLGFCILLVSFLCNEKIDYRKLLEYDCIGISMNIGSLHIFEDIYFYIKDKKPEFPLILGGCIPTFAYKELIEKYENIICMYGEGEQAWYDIASALIKNLPLSINEALLNIGNLAFRLNGENIITQANSVNLNNEKPIIRNKGFLDYIKKNHGIIRIEGSRGCSWNKCSFCCVNAKYADPSRRGFSIKKILDGLTELSEMGFLSPYFTDENFFGQEYERAELERKF